MRTQDPESVRWWRLSFSKQEPEESAYLLIELGASGLHFEGERTVNAFVHASEPRLHEFIDNALALGFKLEASALAPDEDWTNRCEEVWQQLKILDLSIIPVAELSSRPNYQRLPGEILVIPGTGFGTGHHASTRMALELLQSDPVRAARPKMVLDAGTGSGILAFACVELYSADVLAIDTDPLALDNAEDNLNLNGLSKSVTLQLAKLSAVSGTYDLVVANIYAELLIDHLQKFQELIKPEGLLIVSGIVDKLLDSLLSAFEGSGFKVIQQRADSEWCSVLFRRSSGQSA